MGGKKSIARPVVGIVIGFGAIYLLLGAFGVLDSTLFPFFTRKIHVKTVQGQVIVVTATPTVKQNRKVEWVSDDSKPVVYSIKFDPNDSPFDSPTTFNSGVTRRVSKNASYKQFYYDVIGDAGTKPANGIGIIVGH